MRPGLFILCVVLAALRIAACSSSIDVTCEPDCTGRECGPDPVCGEPCGTCGEEAICSDGQCVCLHLACGEACCALGQVCVDGACCTPQCEGKCCGDDGCGGVCPGSCGTGQICNPSTCVCEDVCVPQTCADMGKDCDVWPDGCGGEVDCGDCGEMQTCREGVCECTHEACGESCCGLGEVCHDGSCCAPGCVGRCCGEDGCGGTCADDCALTGQICNPDTCECTGTCVPMSCEDLGKECGVWSSGCAAPYPTEVDCGGCSQGYCDEDGQCVECLGNADCSDDQYCTGVETCSGGVCVPGTPPCADDGLDCTQTCDEDTHQCNAVLPGQCAIDGVCYTEGEPDPLNPCQ
ncbi:MAG: hypothetical protein JXR96_06700, partial [Deltaproteobacteria bacterium]|nr:hypothetical protein [Deltaproteobacteria bacterium]